jgi:formamidopyrimidine-DNA glycosylase
VPEGIEVEYYRRAAERVVGRRIVEVGAPDPWYLKDGIGADLLAGVLVGDRVGAVRRRGKLLVLDLALGARLGLRFGMTGRLVVDGRAPIASLEYAPAREEPAWERFVLRFAGGGVLALQDPRRLGGVLLDPDEDELGPDLYTLTLPELRGALAGSAAPLKARLLDQGRVAGLGNLLVDEILWRAALDPRLPAREVGPEALRRLHRAIRTTVSQLDSRGGSHTGDLFDQRCRGGRCPKDGSALERFTIGGRTTYACPTHQCV